MPIYEYQCSQCKERHEVIQRFSDAPMSHCPSCGGDMKKLPSSPAIQFKGSGFYKTDYGRGSGKRDGDKPDKSDSSEKKEKTDSKPEKKSEKKPAEA